MNKKDKIYYYGEKRSRGYEKKVEYDKKLKHRNLILDELLLECPSDLLLNKDQVQMVRNLISTFNHLFKYLHGKASEETIILAFIIFERKVEKTSIKIEDYRICKKYNLTSPVYMNIIGKIADYYMLTSPLTIKQTTSYNHELLIKNRGQ